MKRILVVEDEFGIADAIRDVLVEAGYEVFLAIHGRQGLELAERHRPHLILVDWMMPFVDGLEMARQLKGDPSLAKVPIILMTAVAGRAPAEAQDLVVAVLSKPFGLDALLAAVTQHLGLALPS